MRVKFLCIICRFWPYFGSLYKFSTNDKMNYRYFQIDFADKLKAIVK